MELHSLFFAAGAVFAAIGLYQIFVKKVPASNYVTSAYSGLLLVAYILK